MLLMQSSQRAILPACQILTFALTQRSPFVSAHSPPSVKVLLPGIAGRFMVEHA